MGAPESGVQAAEKAPAEALLTAFRTIKAEERARHAAVLDYWLSIRGDKEFPPLHDLDPLKISDAGPSSVLLELIGGGQDAEVRHLGNELEQHVAVERIIDAPSPSLLSSLASKLPIVAISRDFLSFEDSFDHDGGWTRLWVTLLPLSSCGSWVDYVYAFVTVETSRGKVGKEEPQPAAPVAAQAEAAKDAADEEPATAAGGAPIEAEAAEPAAEPPAAEAEPMAEPEPEPEPMDAPEAEVELERQADADATDDDTPAEPTAEPEAAEPVAELEPGPEPEAELPSEPDPEPEARPDESASAGKGAPGFSKLLDGIAQLTGFYGQGVKVDPEIVDVPADEPPGPEVESAAADRPAVEPAAQTEPEEPALEAPAPQIEPAPAAAPEPQPAMEGSLQSKLTEVRAKAEEAVQARLRAVAALNEGLSEAYDFALDAETSPEEYLRLVEAEGLKIQLRAPMAPVARLAFGESCDSDTIGHCETVLAWALKQELPRGALLERINEAGGISELAAAVSRAG